ncbi:MAG: hypothetical protein AB2421_17795 [Thermotaleaceae bacterium]
MSEIIDNMPEARTQKLIDMMGAVRGMNLSEKEMKFIDWLSTWDADTANNFISIIEKARAE